MPKVKSLTARLLDSAPEARGGLNSWLIKGARECQKSGVKLDQAFALIADTITARGGEIFEHDINRAISKAYSQSFTGGTYEPRPAWPEPDLKLIEKIVADANGFAVADLQERSPIRFSDELPHSAEVVEALLACEDETLICIGASRSNFLTSDFRSLRDELPNTQLIVPSPMRSVWGKAQEGHESMHTLDNTGPRRNIVLDFDIAKIDKEGNPTKWVPLIEKWDKNGITVKDATSALIWHLKEKGRLVCIVDSAGKSLHAWFRCAVGAPEEDGSLLRRFFEYAVTIGADRQLWTRSQFVRVPDGLRDGKRQTVLYFDRDGAKQATSTPRNSADENEHFRTEEKMEHDSNNGSGSRVDGDIDARELIWKELEDRGGMSRERFDFLMKQLFPVILPRPGRNESKFADDILATLPENTLFRRGDCTVEVIKDDVAKDGAREQYELGAKGLKFSVMTPIRFRTWVEQYIATGITVEEKTDTTFFEKTMAELQARGVLANPGFQKGLPEIKRILDVPIPIRTQSGKTIYPKPGYNPSLKIYCETDVPEIKEIGLDKALDVLRNQVYLGFCFKDNLSKVHAIARLLTPYGRGIMGFHEKTPLWHFEANRPRAGKDYCAGITQIVYQGSAFEDAALGDSSEETRKRITSALVAGRRTMHFANCQGHISDRYFIQAITGPTFNTRMLGSTDAKSDLELPNEIEFSISANVGLTYREDVGPRCRSIELAYFDENENSRQFPNNYLHAWVKDNRSLILSAIHTVFKHWQKMGCPGGKTPFTSFPKWAEVIGGVMAAAGLGDPCLPDADHGKFGGDLKKITMEALYEHCYEVFPNDPLKKTDIYDLIIAGQKEDDRLSWFGDLEGIDKLTTRTKVGKAIKAYQGRELSGIKMTIDDSNVKSIHHLVTFTKSN
jgi:hypothetical protein